jgi:hypothetical protein
MTDTREQWASLLYAIGGWETFAPTEPDERGYVSRLWAADWDCEEDSTYDEETP